MGDQGRWFKLWTSAPADDDLQSLPPALRWAWAAFGAYTKLHGSRGVIAVNPTNAALAAQLGVAPEAVIDTLKRLPHMTVEEGKRANGFAVVTWHNWRKYQEDSTVAKRVADLRSKRRREEKRGEEKKIPSPLTPSPLFTLDPEFLQAVDRLPRFREVAKLRSSAWWQSMIEAYPTIDHVAQMQDAHGWLLTKGRGYRDMPSFLRNWFKRAQDDEGRES